MSLLLQITLFLGAALLVVPLLKRLGIATVLGYLITGIVLGPHVLNIANDPEAIHKLAEFGVIFLMFFNWVGAATTTALDHASIHFCHRQCAGGDHCGGDWYHSIFPVATRHRHQSGNRQCVGTVLNRICLTTVDRKAATEYQLWSTVFLDFAIPRYCRNSANCRDSPTRGE